MAHKQREIFRNDREFKRFLGKKFDNFDVAGALALGKYSFLKDEEIFKGLTAVHMFKLLNKNFGQFIDTKRSKCIGRKFAIIFTTEELQEEAKAIQQEDEAVEVVEVAKVVVEEAKEVVTNFDLAYAESLYNADNKAESKDALEVYGLNFGVDLKKNKSFENMLKDLVTKCEG